MGWLEALVLGIVQGLTEFLPISSSAHQSIVGQFFGGQDPGAAFTAITQLGTEAAVIVYFRHDLALIIKNWFLALLGRIPRDDPEARMGWMVIVGSIPIIILGLLFQKQIETSLRNLWITVAMLAIVGIVMGIADRTARNERTLDRLTWPHGLIYGLAQSLALVPGVSRSGATITAGLFMGYRREAAAQVLLPARHSRRRRIRPVPAARHQLRPGAARLGTDRARHDRLVRHRIRGDRLVCCATSVRTASCRS